MNLFHLMARTIFSPVVCALQLTKNRGYVRRIGLKIGWRTRRYFQVAARHSKAEYEGIGTDEWSGNQEGRPASRGNQSSPQPGSAPSSHNRLSCTQHMKPTIGIRSKGSYAIPMGSRAPIQKSWSRTREFHTGRPSRRMTEGITRRRFTCITTTWVIRSWSR